MTADVLTRHQARAHALAEKLIEFLQTGEVPGGVFAADMFCDLIMPTWRLQASGVEDDRPHRRRGPGHGPAAAPDRAYRQRVPVSAGPGRAGRLAALTERHGVPANLMPSGNRIGPWRED